LNEWKLKYPIYLFFVQCYGFNFKHRLQKIIEYDIANEENVDKKSKKEENVKKLIICGLSAQCTAHVLICRDIGSIEHHELCELFETIAKRDIINLEN
jgi:hypothetical protein